MGRCKIDTTRKLPASKINSTFSKRKHGAMNKAKELGKLCDVDVLLIAFHPHNNTAIAVSHGGTVDDIIHKFHRFRQMHPDQIQYSQEVRQVGPVQPVRPRWEPPELGAPGDPNAHPHQQMPQFFRPGMPLQGNYDFYMDNGVVNNGVGAHQQQNMQQGVINHQNVLNNPPPYYPIL